MAASWAARAALLNPLAPTIDNAAGTIAVGAISSGAMDGPSGTGKLAVVHFRGKPQSGNSPLTLSNVVLTDVDSFPQPSTVVNGSIAVKPFVIRLNPASTQIYIIDPKFRVDVVAECAYDLGSFQFDLDWDASIAKADEVTDGGFISALRPISELGPNIDNTAGYLDYGQISFGSAPGPERQRHPGAHRLHGPEGGLRVASGPAERQGDGHPQPGRNPDRLRWRAVRQGLRAQQHRGPGLVRHQRERRPRTRVSPAWLGVKVTLTGTDEFAQAVSKSAITDADGKYLFDGLRAGLYQVKVDETTLPANHFLTTGNNPTWVTLARGENRLDVDFGYTKPALGRLGLHRHQRERRP